MYFYKWDVIPMFYTHIIFRGKSELLSYRLNTVGHSKYNFV